MRIDYAKLKKYPALMLLIGVYAISCAVVAYNWWSARGGAGAGRKIVLRMAHWQLEPGIRGAVQQVADDYEKLHPNVEVRQILIPEEGYFRWVNTQLIGGKAPDMIECGMGPSQLWEKFYARYFMSLNEYVDEPNPYNAGTGHEDTPWRLTYFDEMEGGYQETLKSYYRVPLSAFTQRLYYNSEMVAEVWPAETKGAKFPQAFVEFLELCRALKKQKRAEEVDFVPIAGSQYSFDRIVDNYQVAMTANYLDRLDVDYNGTVSRMESAGPIYSGEVQLTEPSIRSVFEVLRKISDLSPPGATSLDRDEVTFLFIQGNAAMIPTGSWDYQTLVGQADFEVEVTDQRMPLPAKDHPEYGPYVEGPQTEADTRGGFPFGITKASRHPKQALDFLQYLSSVRVNEKLNREMFWLPAVLAAEPAEELKPFMPKIEGFSKTIEFEGPNTELPYKQKLPLYLSQKISYEEFVSDYMDSYRKRLPQQAGVRTHVRGITQTIDQQMRLALARRAALVGATGTAGIVAGTPEERYAGIMEGYVEQLNSRDHETRVWMEHARLYQQKQQKQE